MTPFTPLTPDQLLAALNWRYAVKAFDPSKKIPAATWAALEQAMVLAPSSFGLQPWKFVVVSDPAVRAKLRPLSWNQSQVTDASHFVVFATQVGMTEAQINRYADEIARQRGPSQDVENYRGMMLGFLKGLPPGTDTTAWNTKQVYLALGHFMVAAAALGVDTCPMEGITHAKYDEILNLPAQGYRTCVACAVGYRSDADWLAKLKKVRYSAEQVILRV